MSKQIEKLERELAKADARIAAIIQRPADDPIWADEVFWSGRWIAMVDRSGSLVDEIVRLRRAEWSDQGGK